MTADESDLPPRRPSNLRVARRSVDQTSYSPVVSVSLGLPGSAGRTRGLTATQAVRAWTFDKR